MESLFLSLWNRSIAAGWLILAVIVLRLVLQRAPKSVRPWLWAMVGIRLVWPRFGKSILSLIPSTETIPQASLARDAISVQSGVAAFNSAVNEQLVDYYETANVPAGHTRSFVFVCAAVWIAGMVLLILWAAGSYLRLRRQVAEAVRTEQDVWVCGQIDAPFLLGIVRPRIYLPVGLAEESREYVLAHERAHIRRRDYLVKLLGLLLLAVYWFQPLVWAAYVLLCRDIELACDERVIAEMGSSCKKPYSAALLECSVHRGGMAALAFGEVGVKERVKNVLNYKKPPFWMAAACIAVLVVVGVCFLTDPVQAKDQNSQTPFYFRDISQPDESEAFAAGALLYEHAALNYMPVDGSDYTNILYGGETLTLTFGGETTTYHLDKTVVMAWDNLYDYFPTLDQQEEWLDTLLTDHNDLVIAARFYGDGSSGPSIWTVQKENGGGQRWWLGMQGNQPGRLYALIRLEDAFPFMANGALWTYAPGQSTILPVRFDVEGGAKIYAGPDGLLSLDPSGDEWVKNLTVEEGQTVYWKPPVDQSGKPMANTGLHYSCTYDLPTMNTPYQEEDTLTIRPVMDYTGLYGGVTYGVSNNWLGAFSSQTHFTSLGVDGVTGELVVSTYTSGGPYMTQDEYGDVGSVSGRSGPVMTYDVPAANE